VRSGALAERPFRLLFIGQGASSVGDGVVTVALAFAVLDLTGSVRDLGFVLAAQVVPLVLFVLLGGVWADRLPRRSVMLGSDLVRAGSQGASAALLLSGSAHIWQLAALQAVYGTARAFFSPAASGLVPEVVAPEHLQQANALMGVSENVAEVVGPALAGVLLVTAGPGWGLAFDGATFLVSAASLQLMRLPPSAVTVGRLGMLRELREGWQAFRSRRWLWVSVSYFTLIIPLEISPLQVLGPQVARTSLGGAAAWAAISAVWGLGALLGGVIGLRWRPRHPLRSGFLLTLVGGPAFLGVLAASAPLVLVLVGAVVWSMAATLFNVFWFTAIQREIPAGELSRVSSWDHLGTYVFKPVGLAAVGPVALAVGVHTTLYCCAGLLVVLTGGVLAVPAVRNFASR
jgi:MFS family permease